MWAMNTTFAALASTMVEDYGIGWRQSSPDEASSFTRCSTQFAASSPPWVSTDYWTSTSYAYRSRTELLTPKPSTTSVLATSTYTEYETAPNNFTKTVYTDTYTWTDYQTQYETISVTSTATESKFYTTTIATQAGLTPIAVTYPEATRHVDEYNDDDLWSVEDSYSQDDPGVPQESEIPVALQSGPASKVDCLVTLVNVYYQGTTSSKLYVTPPTYTRTKYVTTLSTTSTVRTKVSPSDSTVTTLTMASGLRSISWFTETRTNVATTTTTEYPDTVTSVYAGCATDNVVDSYKGWPLDRLADDWHSKNYTVISSGWDEIANETACCASAATNPNSIFFKYDGSTCEVFVDDDVSYGYNATTKIDVPVLYEPRDRGWYGLTVGNGPRGSISFSSLWE
ncbi:Nn.00g044830.m01.CDS01 [Neocucurbitaria sp. VM-36]